MKTELADAFGRPPREPLQNDGFITEMCECLVKYLPDAKTSPLDFEMWNELLFADGVVYDFERDVLRPQCAEDRLWRHTRRGVPC